MSMSQPDDECIILPHDDHITSSSSNNTETDTNPSPSFTKLDIISKNEDESIRLSYGNLITFCYRHNDPLFAIGPDWPYFTCMYAMNIGIIIFIMSMLWRNSYSIILMIGVFMSLVQLSSYLLISISNPGLPKYKYTQIANEGNTQKQGLKLKKCKECNLWLNANSKYYHCFQCRVCVEGFDHHCPWTTKCVAKGNLYYFYIFLGATFGLFSYFIFAVVMMR